jgi:hypothetical protein
MHKWLRIMSVSVALAGGVIWSAGCAGPGYDGGGGVVYYNYDYYPDWDVYYYPQGRIYYWNEGGHWRSGAALPPRYDIQSRPHENLQLHTQQPWTEHHPASRPSEPPPEQHH